MDPSPDRTRLRSNSDSGTSPSLHLLVPSDEGPFQRRMFGGRLKSSDGKLNLTNLDLRLPADEDTMSLNLTETPLQATVASSTKLSSVQASLSLLKCVVGAGSFILPAAFKDAGLVAGFISLLFLGLLSAFTIRQLGLAGRVVAAANPHRRVPTYVDVGRAVLGKYPSYVIMVGVVATILGVCAVYVDFIAQLVSEVVDNKVTQRDVQFILVLPLVLLAFLRDFRYLAWTSVVGDIAVTAGAITVIAYGAHHQGMHSPRDLPAFKPHTYSRFFGQSVFLFAVHAVILPISQALDRPTKFGVVVNWTYLGVVVVNALFGALGYMVYGDETKSMVLDNVKGDIADIVKVLLAADLLFTIPIVLSAPRRILERAFISKTSETRVIRENIVRTVCVLLFIGLAVAIPDINDLATLVGGMVSPLMGFIFPPLMTIRLFGARDGKLWMALNICIMVFGAFAGVYTTVKQIQSMWDKHHH